MTSINQPKNTQRNILIMMLIFILLSVSMFFILSNMPVGTSDSVRFDGKNNIKCHSIKVEDNFMGAYHFENKCNKLIK